MVRPPTIRHIARASPFLQGRHTSDLLVHCDSGYIPFPSSLPILISLSCFCGERGPAVRAAASRFNGRCGRVCNVAAVQHHAIGRYVWRRRRNKHHSVVVDDDAVKWNRGYASTFECRLTMVVYDDDDV